MVIGCVKEILTQEYRVGLTPAGAKELIADGHEVLIERGAGLGSNFSDEAYAPLGVRFGTAEEVWRHSDMIIKVKQPLKSEFPYLREDQILFTYLHLAAHEDLTHRLVEAKTPSIAYETIKSPDGRLPLLAPMSEVAGRLAVQAGATLLQQNNGGKGILIGGVPGVKPAEVVVIGGGFSGKSAVKVAYGMGAHVTVLDRKADVLRWFDDAYSGAVKTLWSNSFNIEGAVTSADLVIGTVLIPGAAAPKLVTREMLSKMEKGSVAVDVAVDQGGCFETTRPTTYDEPTYVEEGVIHYCVANMPGGTPYTSTIALTSQTLPYIQKLAKGDLKGVLSSDTGLALGVNTFEGKVTCEGVAEAWKLPYTPLERLLSGANRRIGLDSSLHSQATQRPE